MSIFQLPLFSDNKYEGGQESKYIYRHNLTKTRPRGMKDDSRMTDVCRRSSLTTRRAIISVADP